MNAQPLQLIRHPLHASVIDIDLVFRGNETFWVFVFNFYVLKFSIVIWYNLGQLTQLAIFQDNQDLMLPQILFYFGSLSIRSLSTLNPISPLCNWANQKLIPYALVFILVLHLWTYSSTLHILEMLGSPSTVLRMCFSWAQLIKNPWIQSCQRAFDWLVRANQLRGV